jgi:hypothetical protein
MGLACYSFPDNAFVERESISSPLAGKGLPTYAKIFLLNSIAIVFLD